MHALIYTDRKASAQGFTLLELLTVMAIIITLAGIILAGVGYAQQKAARERATAEIAALSTALESYKIDNGDYPRGTAADPPNTAVAVSGTPSTDIAGLLFRSLRGTTSTRGYYEFKGDMMNDGKVDTATTSTTGRYIVDPFGTAYGYSTRGDNNPTFDLWSTGGATGNTAAAQAKWVTNW